MKIAKSYIVIRENFACIRFIQLFTQIRYIPPKRFVQITNLFLEKKNDLNNLLTIQRKEVLTFQYYYFDILTFRIMQLIKQMLTLRKVVFQNKHFYARCAIFSSEANINLSHKVIN